jgi:hypothetical protein
MLGEDQKLCMDAMWYYIAKNKDGKLLKEQQL